VRAAGVWTTVENHLGSRQVARVIYGAIIGLALVVTLEAHPPGDGVVAGSLVATAVAVALAEVYSEIVGTETRTRRRVRREELEHFWGDALAVFVGVGFPAIFFVLAMAGALETNTAFTLAKWSGVGLIGFYGFCAARLAGAGLARSLVQALAVAAIGAVLIAVKALLH
jgi:VIT1/CCC1 family predicted Fe2+/Mn2+ transporter